MTLSVTQLEALCQIAMDAAVATGRYVATTRPQHVDHKAGDRSLASQVVTEVDRVAQEQLLDALAPTFVEHDLALLAEESPDDGSRLKKAYFWCIDPIDGTLCFIDGKPGYAVAISLISRDGVAHIGVVYDPVAQVLYHAIRDRGAFRNQIPWYPQLTATDAPLRVFTDRSEADSALFSPTVQALGATVENYGGGVLNALWCLESAPAIYFKWPKPALGGGCFWDFAATACIFREAGGWASDARGQPFDFNRVDSVCLNHCGVLYATSKTIAERCVALAPAGG